MFERPPRYTCPLGARQPRASRAVRRAARGHRRGTRRRRMARVAVIGGGLAGSGSAVRLAKLGHDVTLLEARSRVGGAVGHVEQDGFRWDAGPAATALPAVLRDLFRKSGRPLEKELELLPVQPLREHRFPDGTGVSL